MEIYLVDPFCEMCNSIFNNDASVKDFTAYRIGNYLNVSKYICEERMSDSRLNLWYKLRLTNYRKKKVIM